MNQIHKLRKASFLIFSNLSIMCFLSGCIMCDECADGMANAIWFTFSINAEPDSFTEQELDTVAIYQLDRITGDTIDSAIIHENTFTLSEALSLFDDERFWDYDYLIQPQSSQNFRVKGIQVAGEHRGTFCRCYHNTKKKFTVNGTEYDFSGKEGAWFDNNVELKK